MRQYEGMFLFDPAVASDWESVKAEITRLMDRAGARVIVCTKWDDRRLAYEIQGRKRGVYVLTFFEAEASKISALERDARLSEAVLRCLVLRADHLTEEEISKISDRSLESSDVDAEQAEHQGREDKGTNSYVADRASQDTTSKRDLQQSVADKKTPPDSKNEGVTPDETTDIDQPED